MSAQSTAAGIGLLLQLIEQAARVSSVIRTAQAEGRDVTPAELAEIVAENDAARSKLVDAISRASNP
jgi:RNA:NAD 2'-phosphotransferase (TPT1/KptA family)